MANLLSTTVNGQLNTGNVIDLGYTVNGSISTTAFRGINFHTFSDYQYLIGKRAGAWTQPLDITFYTGIRYHAHQAYGGHKFYTGGFDSNFAFSIGDGDANVRIANTLIFSSSNGTMISNGTMTDAIGWNSSYGTYIGSTVGGTYYIYGNGRFYDNGTIRTLIHSGNIGSQNVNSASYSNYVIDSSSVRITSPVSAFSVNNGYPSGAIRINLPRAVYNNNTMMSMTVDVYEYSTGQSFTLRIGGYNYLDGGWYNVFASLINDSGQNNNIPVYFGNNGSDRNVIWIGEPNWGFAYPNVFVRDFQAGHSQNSGWASDWSISFDPNPRTNVGASRIAYKQIDAGNITSSHFHDLARYSLRSPGNVDSMTSSNFRTQLFGSSGSGHNISTARWNSVPSGLSGMNMYGTMLAWSGSDTHGFIAADYSTANIQVGGGSGDSITWKATLIHSGNISSQSVSYATSAGTLSSGATVSTLNAAAGTSFVAQGYNNNGGFAMNNASTYWGLMWNYGSNDWRLGRGSQIAQNGWNLRWDASDNVYTNGTLNANYFRNGSVWINNGTDYNDYNENIRLFNAPNGVSVIAFSASGTGGTPITSLLGFSDRLETRVSNTWEQRIYGGYVEARGSFRAPIFYDSDDTGFYLDPNGTSNLRKFSTFTMAYNGMNPLSANSPYVDRYNGSAGYRNGTMGYGNTDFNTIARNWGSGFIDTWSSPANAPGGSSHYIGLQGVHYSDGGTSFYGFQMACAGEADNRFFWRSSWPSMRSWVEMIHSGNIGSQSVSYATSAGNSSTTSQIVFNDLKTNFPSGAGGGHSFAANHYSMGLDSGNGGWDHPHYRDVIIGYHTGIRFGAAYSGIRFYNNSPTTDANNDGNGDSGESLLMTIGGYVGTANGTDVVVNNNLFANVSMRAPIFYDSNNTGYYGDFASTSVMNAIRLGTSTNSGTISGGGDWGIRFANDNGWIQFGPANNSWTHIYTDKSFYFNQELYVNGTQVVKNSGTWSINISGNAASASSVAWSNVSSKPANWLNATNLIEGFEPSGTAKPSGFYESYLGSGNPTGTWFNFINVRHSNPDNGHGFQIGMSYYDNNLWFRSYQGSTSPSFQSWSRALGTNTDPYPSNMDQYVRTSDSVTFGGVTSPTILVNNQSDNTKGYRIWNTSNTSVSAMFVNSSNQLVIAAGAVDQVNLNKKVYVNGVALGVNVAPSATAGRIDASNDIVAYSTSDERFKENITPISNALDKVKTLTGVEFDWRMETKDYHGYVGHDVGVIAQQVKAVLPEAVRTNANGYLAVRYEKLIGLLIEGMKEQQEQIEELKAQLNGLTK